MDASPLFKMVEICRTTAEDTFVASYPAHLIRKPVPPDEETDSAKRPAARGFKTARASSTSCNEEDLVEWEQTLELLPIRKRAGAIFQDRISVGRTRNSDIVIDHPKVSKSHAYFSIMAGSYFVTDIGSTNGTFVSGQRLTPNQKVPLQDECELRFGTQATTFLLPRSLYRLLRARRALR